MSGGNGHARVPDAATHAAMLVVHDGVCSVFRELIKLEEEECRMFERLRLERGALLTRMGKQLDRLSRLINPRETVPHAAERGPAQE